MVLQLLSALCALKKLLKLPGPGMPSHSKQTLWNRVLGFLILMLPLEILCFSKHVKYCGKAFK